MSGPDFLDSFDQVPGGALMARRVSHWWEVAQHQAKLAEGTLRREREGVNQCPLFPNEYVTAPERGMWLLWVLEVGAAGEELQHIATDVCTHHAMRRHAAHLARWCMSAFLNLFAEHQRLLGLPPGYRAHTSGPLGVAWVAAGHIKWELNQFDLVERDGDLSLVADLPAHINTKDKLQRWTEKRHYRLTAETGAFSLAGESTGEPTPPGVGGKGVCGVSRT